MHCRKCNIEAPEDAKICRSCGSILDDGPDILLADSAADAPYPMSWLDPPPAPIEAAVVDVIENSAPPRPYQTPTGSDWQCSKCGSNVPWNYEVCWKCVTVATELSDQPQLNDFLTQAEADQLPPEPQPGPIIEPIDAVPIDAVPIDEVPIHETPVELAPIELVQELTQTACSRCGSRRMMTNVSIQDHHEPSTGTLKAVIYTNPEAALFRGAVHGEIAADICADCGHMDLRVTNPQQLYRKWRATR